MSSAKLTVFLSDRWRRLLLCGRLSFCNSFKSEMLMVLVLSSFGCCDCDCGCNGSCSDTDLVFKPDRMLEMSVGPRMSGRFCCGGGGGGAMEMLRAALKSGRLDDMDWVDWFDCIGGAAVLFPDRNGVPASEFGSRTLVGTGGGGGRWFGM